MAAAGRRGPARCRPPRPCCRRPSSAPSCAAPSMPSARPDTTIVSPARLRCAAKARALSTPCGARVAAADDGDAPAAPSSSSRPCAYSSSGGSAVSSSGGRVVRVAERARHAAPGRLASQASVAAQLLGSRRGLVGQRRPAMGPTQPRAGAPRTAAKTASGDAEGRQQAARRAAADAGRAQQAQPGGEFVAVGSRRPATRRRQGCVKRSPALTGCVHLQDQARRRRGRRRGRRTSGRGVRRAA